MIQSSKKPQPAIPPEHFNLYESNEHKAKHVRYAVFIEQFQKERTVREQCHILSFHMRSDPIHPEFTFAEI
jgi:hypothetical protein